jgi:prolyl 4-hydroxylase
MIFDNELAKNLFEKAVGFLPQTHDDHKVLDFNEMFRIYKYSPGQMHRRKL